MASPLYTGFRLFLPVSEAVNIPLDQLNYVICQLTAILFGLYLRLFLPAKTVPVQWRSLFCLLTGLATIFFMIGWAFWQVLLQLIVCYIIMRCFTHHRHMGLAVFVYALGHMLVTYVLGLYQPLEHMCYDPTYTLMITTQKVTSLAFSLVDWDLIHSQDKGRPVVQEERRKWALKSVPSLFDYLAFMLSFQGVLAGPFCHYNLFVVFIHGKDPRNKQDVLTPIEYMDHPPSLPRTIVSKLAAVMVWLMFAVLVRPMYPDSRNVDPEFIANNSMPVRVAYLYVSLFMDRTKYYVTWILSDVVCNASGLGYSGVDAKGRHTWTAMSMVHVWNIETATSLKKYLDNWNISTTHWLRHVCYMRAPILRMYLTFLLSSLWHGLNSGYYVTFLSATICVAVGRKIRATVRPMFQTSRRLQIVYDIITFFGTQITLAFLVLSFVILDWSAIIRFHSSFYWVLHVSTISLFFLVPSPSKPAKKSIMKDQLQDTHQQQQHAKHRISKRDRKVSFCTDDDENNVDAININNDDDGGGGGKHFKSNRRSSFTSSLPRKTSSADEISEDIYNRLANAAEQDAKKEEDDEKYFRSNRRSSFTSSLPRKTSTSAEISEDIYNRLATGAAEDDDDDDMRFRSNRRSSFTSSLQRQTSTSSEISDDIYNRLATAAAEDSKREDEEKEEEENDGKSFMSNRRSSFTSSLPRKTSTSADISEDIYNRLATAAAEDSKRDDEEEEEDDDYKHFKSNRRSSFTSSLPRKTSTSAEISEDIYNRISTAAVEDSTREDKEENDDDKHFRSNRRSSFTSSLPRQTSTSSEISDDIYNRLATAAAEDSKREEEEEGENDDGRHFVSNRRSSFTSSLSKRTSTAAEISEDIYKKLATAASEDSKKEEEEKEKGEGEGEKKEEEEDDGEVFLMTAPSNGSADTPLLTHRNTKATS